MAENTKIIITAEDKASAVFGKVQASMGSMASAIGLGGGLSAAGLAVMVKGTIDAADEMNDLSQKVGISIQNLAGWTLAANQSGTSMESVAKGVKGLSGYMHDHAEELKAAGITAKDADGALIQLADIFKDMPDGVEKTALAVKLFGKAGMDMIPMLNQGSAGLADAKEKAAEYGRKMAELAPQADEFNDMLAEMALQSKTIGLNISSYMIPGLMGLGKWLKDIKSGGDDAKGAMQWLADLTHSEILSGAANMMGFRSGWKGPGTAWDAAGMGTKAPRGPMLPGENSPAEAEAMRRARLLNPAAAAGTAAKAGRGIDDENDVLYKIQEAVRLQDKAFMAENDKAADALTAKAKAMDELHMARMEMNRIETEGEEAIREALHKTAMAMKDNDTFARDMGLSFSSAFEDAVIGAKSLGDVLKGLGNDIARIIMRKTVTEPMGNALSGMMKGFDFGNLFKAEGGPVSGGQSYIVGERGPEIFTPGASGNITPNNKLVGGGTTNHFSVDMRGASVEAVSRLEQLVMSVNGSIERRAMNVMGQARVRGA